MAGMTAALSGANLVTPTSQRRREGRRKGEGRGEVGRGERGEEQQASCMLPVRQHPGGTVNPPGESSRGPDTARV